MLAVAGLVEKVKNRIDIAIDQFLLG
jgi:hypothetical protein